MIQGQFHRFIGAKAIRSSGHHSDFVVQALNGGAGEFPFGPEPVEDQLAMGAEHSRHRLHRLQAAAPGPLAPRVQEANKVLHGVDKGFNLQLHGWSVGRWRALKFYSHRARYPKADRSAIVYRGPTTSALQFFTSNFLAAHHGGGLGGQGGAQQGTRARGEQYLDGPARSHTLGAAQLLEIQLSFGRQAARLVRVVREGVGRSATGHASHAAGSGLDRRIVDLPTNCAEEPKNHRCECPAPLPGDSGQ